jgi:hypothetical protein
MTRADHYRARAAELYALALNETDPVTRAELEAIAQSYRRLAQLADRNIHTDVVYEPPIERTVAQQQQQQIQPEPDGE